MPGGPAPRRHQALAHHAAAGPGTAELGAAGPARRTRREETAPTWKTPAKAGSAFSGRGTGAAVFQKDLAALAQYQEREGGGLPAQGSTRGSSPPWPPSGWSGSSRARCTSGPPAGPRLRSGPASPVQCRRVRPLHGGDAAPCSGYRRRDATPSPARCSRAPRTRPPEPGHRSPAGGTRTPGPAARTARRGEPPPPSPRGGAPQAGRPGQRHPQAARPRPEPFHRPHVTQHRQPRARGGHHLMGWRPPQRGHHETDLHTRMNQRPGQYGAVGAGDHGQVWSSWRPAAVSTARWPTAGTSRSAQQTASTTASSFSELPGPDELHALLPHPTGARGLSGTTLTSRSTNRPAPQGAAHYRGGRRRKRIRP